MDRRYNASLRYIVAVFWLLAWTQCCECSTPSKGIGLHCQTKSLRTEPFDISFISV